MTIVSVMLVVGVVTHSLFAGVFVGFLLGIFWLAMWSYRGFRKFVIWSLVALAIFIFLISKPWANQSKVSAPRTPVTPPALYRPALVPPVFSQFGDVEASKRPESYCMRVATADEVSAYNEYINKGGDPNQVPILDRLAVALAKNPKFLLDPANRNVLDELVGPRLEPIRAQATPQATAVQQNSSTDFAPRAGLIERDPLKPVPRVQLVNSNAPVTVPKRSAWAPILSEPAAVGRSRAFE